MNSELNGFLALFNVWMNNQNLSPRATLEWPWRLVTLETFDQGDEETWPDQKKDNDKDKYKDKDNDNDKYI